MKVGYVLLDGCADRPNPALNYTTPLEAAFTPNLDSIARRSKLGKVVTVRAGVAPESDIAVFNMLGYSFDSGYPGRGVVEAVGSGLEVRKGDLALRANLASSKGRRIIDRRAGRDLTQHEADGLAEALNSVHLNGAEFEFRATVSYRGVLVIRAEGGLSAEVSNTDPAYSKVGGFGAARATSSDDRVLRCVPESTSLSARMAARLVNEFTVKSLKVLAGSGINRERVRAGKLPANCVLLRDAGDHLPRVDSFKDKYGLKGTAIVEMPAEVGIAKILGMKMVTVSDRRDLDEKRRLFVSELREGTVVYVHIKGPDEFGHDGDALGKKRCIEQVDRDFFSGVAEKTGGAKIGVSCDHATPCSMKMHSSDPVPLLVTTDSKGDSMRFTEKNAAKGSLGDLRGREVLRRIIGGKVRDRASEDS
ncbi:MAG: 2,3-bisphosphoglycerate-independent phosphoglycerate mutase [Thaumarchaeota archaeon]|nr:2,3-bisphosphoglycerate-independent phosphoglycerate mutase [Nitrososphaerota archaeon]